MDEGPIPSHIAACKSPDDMRCPMLVLIDDHPPCIHSIALGHTLWRELFDGILVRGISTPVASSGCEHL